MASWGIGRGFGCVIWAAALVALAPPAAAADAAGTVTPTPTAAPRVPPPGDGHAAAAPRPAKHGRYPMPAADYQHKVEERVLHARERLETRIVRRKLTAERAKEARNRFELSVIEVRKVTADAASDGQITRDEARRVNQSTRALARAVARAR